MERPSVDFTVEICLLYCKAAVAPLRSDQVISPHQKHVIIMSFLGKALQLHLQACNVKSKEEKSGPENMLTESLTGDGTPENIPVLSLTFILCVL